MGCTRGSRCSFTDSGYLSEDPIAKRRQSPASACDEFTQMVSFVWSEIGEPYGEINESINLSEGHPRDRHEMKVLPPCCRALL